MRVGRAALDEDAIRLIEEHHPQIHFDWPQILNGEEEVLPPEPEARTEFADRRTAPAPAMIAPAADVASVMPPAEAPVNPAHARLGSEGLARLRARYAEVVANISRRVQDDHRRQQLNEQARRLNPDTWVTDAEVGGGLEEYESVLASLRDVIGRRRRRKRSRSGGPPAGTTGKDEASVAQADRSEDDGEGDDGAEQ